MLTFSRSLLAALLGSLFVAFLPGQDGSGTATPAPNPTTPAVSGDDHAAGADRPQDSPALSVPATLGRVESAGTTLRCFPTAHSPTYSETLETGDVVELAGEEQSGFVAVRLPVGVLGYVHGTFAEVDAGGLVRSKGKKVAFRYRTNSREAPVRFVDDGTQFLLVEQEGEWLKVRLADQVAWVPRDAVLAFQNNPTVEASWRSFHGRQMAAIEAGAKLRADRDAAAKVLAEASAKIAELEASMRSEMLRPDTDQDYAKLRTELEAVAANLPTESAERRTISRLTAEIERQERALEMMRIVNDAPRPSAAPAAVPAAALDPLRNAEVGWLRVRRPLFGTPSVELEKGGQVLFHVECTAGRYALEVFEGMEVALWGESRRLDAESLRTLDIRKLEVLSSPRR